MPRHMTESNHNSVKGQTNRFLKQGIWSMAAAVVLTAVCVLFVLHPGVYRMFQDLIMMKNVPRLSMNASYGMILAVGVLTSFHCAGMCGGIAITQSVRTGGGPGRLDRFHRYAPSVRYNGGRVLSYTIIGGLAGGLGQVFQFSGVWRGIIPLFGGLFMIIMGINLLGLFKALRRFNLSMPSFAFNFIRTGASRLGPFTIGLLSALMPCGPLQIMQLYALGTGSMVHGALSMLVFSLGTVPMLFLFGALHPMLSKRLVGRILKASALMIIILGVVMLNRGFALSGILIDHGIDVADDAAVARLNPGGKSQTVEARAGENSYPQIVVQKGVPVRWNLHMEEEDLNTCNNAISLGGFKVEKSLVAGDNMILFTPEEKGKFVYTCWMGMIKSSIIVVDDIGRYGGKNASGNVESSVSGAPAERGGSAADRSKAASIPLDEAAELPKPKPGETVTETGRTVDKPEPAIRSGNPGLGRQEGSPAESTGEPGGRNPKPGDGQDVKAERKSGPAAVPPSLNGGKTPAAKAPPPGNRDLAVKAPSAPAPSLPPSALPAAQKTGSGDDTAEESADRKVQTVVTIVSSDSYSSIEVKRGIPVKWIIRAEATQLNDCNNEIIVPAFHVSKKLVAGDNIVEFTPGETGEFPFTCWMEMIESTITVTDEQ